MITPCPDRIQMQIPPYSTATFRQEYPVEETLILHCTNRAPSADEIDQAKHLLRKVDWQRLIRLSHEHGVGALLYRYLQDHFAALIPGQACADLRNYVFANTQNNLGLLREMVNTVSLLEEHRIECAVFKGLVTTQLVYGDFSIRKCGDIDILVAESDYPRAKQLFLSAGFLPTMSDKAEIACLQSGLWHEDRRLKIDLHWGIPPRELGVHAERILRNSTSISLGGRDIPTFSREDMFIILCVNATKEYWGQHLYTYCDIREFLQRHTDLDWNLIIDRARALRCERTLLSGLGVVHALYDTPLPAAIDAGLRRIPSLRRIIDELLQQLFDHNLNRIATQAGDRHLYLFSSSPDYFAALIDNRVRRLLYKTVLRHVLSVETEAQGEDATRPARILGLLLQKLYRKILATLA